MTKPVRMYELHEQQARLAESIGPDAMTLLESVEAACRHVARKNNSYAAMFGLYGTSRNRELCELYVFLLLRHPKLRLSHEQVAEYFLLETESVRDYEAGGVMMAVGAASGDACARLTLACTMLGITGHELMSLK